MKNDNLKAFIELQTALVQEKHELEQRLAEINRVLSGSAPKAVVEAAPAKKRGRPAKSAVAPKATAKPKAGKRGRKPSGKLSLKAAVAEVLKTGAMTKQEIMDAVQKFGYKFTNKNPLNYLQVTLYNKAGKELFENNKGVFSLKGGSGAASSAPAKPKAKARVKAKAKGKKVAAKKAKGLSAAGRKAIAAAQKRRWAKAKKK